MRTDIPERKCTLVEPKRELTRLARLEPRLGEGLQLLVRPGNRRFDVAYVALHRLGAAHRARVRDTHMHGVTVPRGCAQLERRVRQTMAEAEAGLDAARVVPAVADEQALAVSHLTTLAWIVRECGRVLEPYRNRRRQLARRRHVARQHIGQGVPPLFSGEPRLHDRGNIVGPRHLDW